MDEIVQKTIKEVQAKARSSVPWNLDEPWKQSAYVFTEGEWRPDIQINEDKSITALTIYSWNIDFMLPFPDSRMSKGMEHLQSQVTERPRGESTAPVICLQECVQSDIELLAAHPWVREKFAITDVDKSNWQSGHYGTITLIDRRLPIITCFRVHYSETRMERDVLIADVAINGEIIRTCNTHLESLALEPPRRIPQMKLCAAYMRQSSVDGAVIAGDFNAIQEFDQTLHSSNGLKDAYLELGGSEDHDSGHTWGQQAATKLRQQFGTSRMDKVYFCGNLDLQSFEKYGSGVVVDDKAEQQQIVQLGFEKPWITDHLGVKAVFNVPGTRSAL